MRALALAAAVALTAPVTAAALDISPAFTGTIVSTFPDGRHTRLWLQPGGAYIATSRAGALSSGRWKIADDQICMRQQQPFWVPFDYCTPLPASLNTPWRGASAGDAPITIRLVRGRASLRALNFGKPGTGTRPAD